MPLAEHLRELRNRLVKSLAAIFVATVIAAFFYKHIVEFFTDPILDAVGCEYSFAELAKGTDENQCARIVQNGLLSPFTLALTVSLASGVVLSSPVWLYQLWAFVAPGLHRHEKKFSLAFVAAGFPLFLLGAYFAYWSLPKMASVMLEFAIIGTDNQLPLEDLLQLVMRMVVVFGLSFELPLLLVMLNFGGVLSGKKLAGWWRGMIMGITLFAAIATPSTDPLSMLALAPHLDPVLRCHGHRPPQRPPQEPHRGHGPRRRRGVRAGSHPRVHRSGGTRGRPARAGDQGPGQRL
jgi:sec-independent protein translocase protein TatC